MITIILKFRIPAILVLTLRNVTLCGVDTRTPLLALQALQRSSREIQFGKTLLFAVDQPGLRARTSALGVTLIDIGPIHSIADYSTFMLARLGAYISTEFALITQWDGFVLNPHAWSEEFLAYDYVGALWPDRVGPGAVGNGGFSLRSKRLLTALLDPALIVSHPEDRCICDVNRDRLERDHDIRFAPPSLAAKFSYERIRSATLTFGFHGIANLVDAFAPEEMLALVRQMTVEMAFGAGARQLARTLVYDGQYEAAREILNKRIGAGDRRWRVLTLWVRMWCRQRLRVKRKIV